MRLRRLYGVEEQVRMFINLFCSIRNPPQSGTNLALRANQFQIEESGHSLTTWRVVCGQTANRMMNKIPLALLFINV
jgi:hypothetical protein